MGLSTKQVSSDGLDWGQSLLHSGSLELPKPPLLPPARRQPLQQQSEPLPCPRCGSSNTKFCYYNNYNKSQPRHFCRSCKRHWTKGGTLRNVPVGGGRKNKRLKTSNATAAATSTTVATSTSKRNNTHMGIQSHQLSQTFPRTLGDQKNMSEILALINPPPASSSALPLLQNPTTTPPPFNFSSLGSFENNPSPIFAYNFTGGLVSNSMEDTIGLIPSNSIASQPWQVLPTTSSVMDMPNQWNWDDIDSLVSTEINIPWDDHDSEIKPL